MVALDTATVANPAFGLTYEGWTAMGILVGFWRDGREADIEAAPDSVAEATSPVARFEQPEQPKVKAVERSEPHAEPEPSALAKKLAKAESEVVGEDLAAGRPLAQQLAAARAAAPTVTVDPLVAAFLAKGGAVTKCPPSKRRKAA
jgi:hypothetical protein